MINLKDILKEGVLLTDGAMGTYYKEQGGTCHRAEFASVEQPHIIEDIHRQYLDAGARLIRTNTFAANTVALSCDMDYVREVIKASYEIAKRAAEGRDAVIAATVGPIAGAEDMSEYCAIADIWLSLGADTFVFETFIEPDTPTKLAEYIKSANPNAYVHISYALTDTGYTKASYWCGDLTAGADNSKAVDSVGFNCGVGPMHMYNILGKLTLPEKPLFILPNAGYPEMINGRVVYVLNPDYFAQTLCECARHGAAAVGGCCGTTPKHISLLKEGIGRLNSVKPQVREDKTSSTVVSTKESRFYAKLKRGEFVVAVELDPPFKPNSDKLINGARLLKDYADIITIADSPMGKSRVDSIIMSLKLKREVGCEVLPHICCRDKNAVSLRSVLLGAYMEGIRNVLVVTGDPVPGEYRGDIKSVFNMNSYSLMDMISQMNESVFDEGKISIGGAVNFNVKNKDSEFKRLLKKCESGAEFFLTQPIYDLNTVEYVKSLPKERNYKILAGVMPPVSYKNVQFLNNELAGVNIPPELVERFKPDMSREEAQAVGEEIACDIISRVKDYVDGIYIIAPFNRCEMVKSIIEKSLWNN